MHHKQSLALIVITVIMFAVWELIGHWFLMALPMNARHSLDIVVGTALALLIAAVSILTIQRQHKKLVELARLRDYLLRMQKHSLRLSPAEQTDPNVQLEYRTLELKYIDVQQQLAAERPEMRSRAVLDLQALAQTHLPGIREQYPFFVRALSHLTAALYLETEAAPRGQAMHALEELVRFAHDNNTRLLDLVIADLAHANRAALSAMTELLSERFAGIDRVTPDDMKPLLPFACFAGTETTDAAVLEYLMASPSYEEALAAQRLQLKATTTPRTGGGQQLNAIRIAAAGLRDTRDALAEAIRALPEPADLPKEDAVLRFWKRSQPLGLQACFLVGAQLNKAQLQGVDLQHTFLQAASLTDAQLQNADLTNANLWKAQLFAAGLDYAKLWGANLRDASLTAAQLAGADMSRARLQGAHLVGAHLKNTCLWQIAVAEGATKQENCADFGQANWWEARFTDILSGSTDNEVLRWLTYRFPQPLPDGQPAPSEPINPFSHAADDFGKRVVV